jgi:hypothetical protein
LTCATCSGALSTTFCRPLSVRAVPAGAADVAHLAELPGRLEPIPQIVDFFERSHDDRLSRRLPPRSQSNPGSGAGITYRSDIRVQALIGHGRRAASGPPTPRDLGIGRRG